MKKVIICFVLAMMSVAGYAQSVIGKWVTESRKLVGVNILTGLTKKGDKWEGGKIYNPKNGKTYKCSIWIEGNNLKVRGYVAMFYETQTWTKK